MGMEREVQGRSVGRGWRTVGILAWLSVVLFLLSYHWVRYDTWQARWTALQLEFASAVPLGLFAAYGIGRLAWLWWPRRRPKVDAETSVLVFNRKRSATVGFLVLIGAFLLMMFLNLREPDVTWVDGIFPLMLGAGWVAVLIFTLRGGPPLVLDSDGISGLGWRGKQHVAWQSIAKISLHHARLSTTIDFTLTPENSKGQARQLSLAPENYGVEPDAMLQAIEEFHQRKVVFQ